MKKWITWTLSILLLLTAALPVSAEVTGTFVDEIVDGFDAKVVDFSASETHRIAYEYNLDLDCSLLVKQDTSRNPNRVEHITYQMDSQIAGFEFAVMCCAGLGDPLEDLSVFLSKTGAENSWQQVPTQATRYTFDESIYVSFDKAYWHQSTLMNKSRIPSGYKYLKIQFNACTESGDVPWNVAIDTVKIVMGSNVPAPTISPEDKFVSYAELAAQSTTKATTTTAPAPATTTRPGPAATTRPGPAATTRPGGGAGNTTAAGGNGATIGGGTTGPSGETGTTAGNGDATTAPDGSSPALTTTTVPGGSTVTTGTGGAGGGTSSGWLWWVLLVIAVLAIGGGVMLLVKKKKENQ